MTLHDTIATVHETSARSDAAYALSVDILSVANEAGELSRELRLAPGELLSLWNMLRAYAHHFVCLMRAIEDVETGYDTFHQKIEKEAARVGTNANTIVQRLMRGESLGQGTETVRDTLISTCDQLGGMLDTTCAILIQLQLRISESLIGDIRHILIEKLQAGTLQTSLRELRRRIEDELESRLFLFIPQDRAAYWSEDPLFSKKVQRCCRKAVDDMIEAGKCLAVGRHTASVFHLMRVVEIGAKRFATKILRLSLSHKDALGTIIGKISQEVARMPTSTTRELQRKEIFSKTADHLSHIKDGWRNKTMHPGLSFNEEQAILMFNNVREFMQLLVDLK